MFPVRSTPGMKGINIPNVCPEQPQGNTAFCSQHLVIAQARGYPVTVRDFVKFCKDVRVKL